MSPCIGSIQIIKNNPSANPGLISSEVQTYAGIKNTVSTPKVGQTNSSVFLPIPYMGKNNILTMISSRETNLLQKSNRQSLQLIISKAIMDILYGIDSKFFRGLNDRH